MELRNIKFKTHNPIWCEEAMKKLFENGVEWIDGNGGKTQIKLTDNTPYLYVNGQLELARGFEVSSFKEHKNIEVDIWEIINVNNYEIY